MVVGVVSLFVPSVIVTERSVFGRLCAVEFSDKIAEVVIHRYRGWGQAWLIA